MQESQLACKTFGPLMHAGSHANSRKISSVCGGPKEEDGWSSFGGPCSLGMSDEMHSSQDAMRQPGAKGSMSKFHEGEGVDRCSRGKIEFADTLEAVERGRGYLCDSLEG